MLAFAPPMQRARLRPILFACGTALLQACGSKTPSPEAPLAALPAHDAGSEAPPASPAKASFENPGGMWMPHQIPSHADTLKQLGLGIDPALLSDPLSPLLGAVVSLGGCSASFVSDEGLVITNHHCATGALQYNSTPQQNLLTEGFLAKTREEERSNGPAARVFVTRTMRDVSDAIHAVTQGVADESGALPRHREKTEKEVVAACEKGNAGMRCTVASFYNGASYYLIEQLEIRDVRLVCAPPSGVGNFGGEVDNWRWPRHTGDVSIYRAYVGKDGLPADYSTDNVPYRPKHRLQLSTTPVSEGDLIMVAGYPGRTQLLEVGAELEETITWAYPRRLRMFDDYIALIDDLGKTDADVKIKGTSFWRRFNNARTKNKGELEGIARAGLVEKKHAREAEVRKFIEASPARQATYGRVVEDIEQGNQKARKHARSRRRAPKRAPFAQTLLGRATHRADGRGTQQTGRRPRARLPNAQPCDPGKRTPGAGQAVQPQTRPGAPDARARTHAQSAP